MKIELFNGLWIDVMEDFRIFVKAPSVEQQFEIKRQYKKAYENCTEEDYHLMKEAQEKQSSELLFKATRNVSDDELLKYDLLLIKYSCKEFQGLEGIEYKGEEVPENILSVLMPNRNLISTMSGKISEALNWDVDVKKN